MDIHTHTPLSSLTTFKVGGPSHFFAEVYNTEDLQQVYKKASSKQVPIYILGGGSNVIAHDEGFNGLVIKMKIAGFEIISDDIETTDIKVGAGEGWDSFVARTVEMGLTSVECLSAIPGSVGASPVQNIGAYGQEVSDAIISVDAYDSINDSFVTLDNIDCEFSYRHSIFRGSEKGRYVITAVTFRLTKNPPLTPFYDSLQAYFDEHGITDITTQVVRDAVIAIRADKLPDPAQYPSAGSFFKNTIVEEWQVNEIKGLFPDVKAYDMGDNSFKISSGWLIEKCGFKGQLLHGIRVHDKNCLVLINESATGYADIQAARDEITTKVRDTFRVELQQEPLEIPLG